MITDQVAVHIQPLQEQLLRSETTTAILQQELQNLTLRADTNFLQIREDSEHTIIDT